MSIKQSKPNEFKSDSVASRRQLRKMETQEKLLAATRALLASGDKISIAVAAKKAGISVATAYRYYSDPEKMRRAAALNRKFGPDPDVFLDRFEQLCEGSETPLERLIIAQRMMFDFVREHVQEYRGFIASSHEHLRGETSTQKKASSGGRRIILLEAALAPLKDTLSEEKFCELVYRVMPVSGPEPFFVLQDYTSQDIDAIWRTNEAILRAVYTDFMRDAA